MEYPEIKLNKIGKIDIQDCIKNYNNGIVNCEELNCQDCVFNDEYEIKKYLISLKNELREKKLERILK